MRLSLQNRINDLIARLTPVLGIIAFVSLFSKYGFHLPDFWITNLLILDEIIAAFFVITLLLKFFISDTKWQYVRQSPFEFGLLLLFVISIVFEEIMSIEEPHILIKRTTTHSIIKLYFVNSVRLCRIGRQLVYCWHMVFPVWVLWYIH